MKVKLISWTSNPIKTIEQAASMCYQSEPSIAAVKSCFRNGHESIFEHCNFTFLIEGVSRALLAQLTRHRIGIAFTVLSQRYVNMSETGMVCPPPRKSQENWEEIESIYKNFYAQSLEVYNKLNELKEPKEDARLVLPNACYTNLIMTINLREENHLCNERLCARAQWEIRELVKEIRKQTCSCPDLDEEERTFINSILVPKCRKGAIPVCTEGKKSCGLSPLPSAYVLKDEEETVYVKDFSSR